MKIVFASTVDDGNPSGGAKYTYRHIDVLNELGFDASFSHIYDVRYSWFENHTRLVPRKNLSLSEDDFLILPEIVDRIPDVKGSDRCGKVVLCQNSHFILYGFNKNVAEIKKFYDGVNCVICISEFDRERISFLFPNKQVFRVRYSFDRPPFNLGTNKKKLFSVMTRKRSKEIEGVFACSALRGYPDGWSSQIIDGKKEKEVADILGESTVFLSFSHQEGFGMPACEAMACGCVVLGYTGGGGEEYFSLLPKERVVLDGDYVGLAKTLFDVLGRPFESLVEEGVENRKKIIDAYSTAKEVESMKEAWTKITEKKIEVSSQAKRIKAVIMHHNMPDNADRLFETLSGTFDDVEIFDNGSDPTLIPINMTRSRDNVYWTGTWNEVIDTCKDCDAVWVLGCDIVLKNSAAEYRKAIEDSLPFGCWSPCVEGRAQPFMQAGNYKDGVPVRVKNIEGMCLAVSGELLRSLDALPEGSKYGYGHDFWLCYKSREKGLCNVIDGRVVVYHPSGRSYNDKEACDLMDKTYGGLYGNDFRKTVFEYSPTFEGNKMNGKTQDISVVSSIPTEIRKYTIATVTSNCGLQEFLDIVLKFKNDRIVVVRKGVVPFEVEGIEVVDHDRFEEVLKEANVFVFPTVGAFNKSEYEKVVSLGVPVVVRDRDSLGLVDHEKNGWLFQNPSWAQHWIEMLRGRPRKVLTEKGVPRVTIITPTKRRALDVIKRCIDCVRLQTMTNWNQIICSDGEREEFVENLVSSIKDSRISYDFTSTRKGNDYGNTVRSEMLKKATGDFVLFLDDDNIILPHYLEKMLDVITNADADYSVCHIVHFGPLNEMEVGRPPLVLTGDPIKLYYIDPLQFLVKRGLMQNIGWDTEVGYLSDGVTLEKLKSHKIARVNEVLGLHM